MPRFLTIVATTANFVDTGVDVRLEARACDRAAMLTDLAVLLNRQARRDAESAANDAHYRWRLAEYEKEHGHVPLPYLSPFYQPAAPKPDFTPAVVPPTELPEYVRIAAWAAAAKVGDRARAFGAEIGQILIVAVPGDLPDFAEHIDFAQED